MFCKKLLFFGLFFVSACGFTPMNKLSTDLPTSSLTEQITIANIPNYEGWQLKQQLSNQLNPRKNHTNKKYTLVVNLNAPTFTDQSIQGDNFASRETARMTAKYTLKNIETGEILLNDKTTATGAYNIVKEPYATNVARDQLKENLITIIADNISVRIIAYFKSTEDIRESQTISN